MERKKVDSKPGKPAAAASRSNEYDLETPLWQKYYERVRKTARFPRYYKRELNW